MEHARRDLGDPRETGGFEQHRLGLLEFFVRFGQFGRALGDPAFQPLVAPAQVGRPHAMPSQEGQEETNRRRAPKPRGLVKERLLHDVHAGPGRVPDAVIVAGDHLKPVTTRAEVGVERNPARAHVGPAPIVPVQTITEMHLGRPDKTHRGVLDRQAAGARRKFDGVDAGGGLVVDEDAFDPDRRHGRVEGQRLRINFDQAVARREPEGPIGRLPDGGRGPRSHRARLDALARPGEAEVGRPELTAGHGKQFRLWHPHDAFGRTEPQPVVTVFENRRNLIVERFREGVRMQPMSVVENHQAVAPGADPQRSVGRRIDCADVAGRETGVGFEAGHDVPFQPDEAAAKQPGVNRALGVFSEGPRDRLLDPGIVRRGGRRNHVIELGECVILVPHHAAADLGPDPNRTRPVLKQRPDALKPRKLLELPFAPDKERAARADPSTAVCRSEHRPNFGASTAPKIDDRGFPIGSDPDGTLRRQGRPNIADPVHGHRSYHDVIRQQPFHRNRVKTGRLHAGDPISRAAHPITSFVVLDDRPQVVVQSRERHLGEGAVLRIGQPIKAGRGGPHLAVRIGVQGADRFLGEPLRQAVFGHFATAQAQQPLVRTDPERAARALHKRVGQSNPILQATLEEMEPVVLQIGYPRGANP